MGVAQADEKTAEQSVGVAAKSPFSLSSRLINLFTSCLTSMIKMAVLSSTTLLRTLSLFHLTLAYYLITAPSILVQQNLVVVLGAAMDLPLPSPSLSVPSSATALAGAFIALLAISDFTASGMPEEISSMFWSSQAPTRLAFFFAITGWSYLGKFGIESGVTGRIKGAGLAGVGPREATCNSLVFSWGFLEMTSWFWVSQDW